MVAVGSRTLAHAIRSRRRRPARNGPAPAHGAEAGMPRIRADGISGSAELCPLQPESQPRERSRQPRSFRHAIAARPEEQPIGHPRTTARPRPRRSGVHAPPAPTIPRSHMRMRSPRSPSSDAERHPPGWIPMRASSPASARISRPAPPRPKRTAKKKEALAGRSLSPARPRTHAHEKAPRTRLAVSGALPFRTALRRDWSARPPARRPRAGDSARGAFAPTPQDRTRSAPRRD